MPRASLRAVFAAVRTENALPAAPLQRGRRGGPGPERVQACSAGRSSALRRRLYGSLSPSKSGHRNCKTGTSTASLTKDRFPVWMRECRVWPGETEDNLRIAPCPNRNRRPAVAQQDVASDLHRRAIDVRADEERTPLDSFFPARRLAGLEAGVLQRARSVAGHVPGGVAERGRQRPVRHDRRDSRYHDGDRGGQVRGELA